MVPSGVEISHQNIVGVRVLVELLEFGDRPAPFLESAIRGRLRVHRDEPHRNRPVVEAHCAAGHVGGDGIDVGLARILERQRREQRVAEIAVGARGLRIRQQLRDAGRLKVLEEVRRGLLQRQHLHMIVSHGVHDCGGIGVPLVHIAGHQARHGVGGVGTWQRLRRQRASRKRGAVMVERQLPAHLDYYKTHQPQSR